MSKQLHQSSGSEQAKKTQAGELFAKFGDERINDAADNRDKVENVPGIPEIVLQHSTVSKRTIENYAGRKGEIRSGLEGQGSDGRMLDVRVGGKQSLDVGLRLDGRDTCT